MTKAIRFWANCWIYPRKSERETMFAIIKLLKKNKSVSTYNMVTEVKEFRSNASHYSVKNALNFLLVLRVIKVEQHKETRVYLLEKNWNFMMEKAIITYNHL